MKTVNPMNTNRAGSWSLYHNAPMPMVTIFKTLDITNLRTCSSKGYQLNMLLCYCIGVAAMKIKEFYLLPAGENMMEYDQLGINVIVANKIGGINACDLPVTKDLDVFHQSYVTYTTQVHDTCKDYEIENRMIIGTSSLIKYEIDGVINMYSGIFNNPFLIWGKYRNENERMKLQISFQFHHVQMDGMEACEFLEELQRVIDSIHEK